MKRARAANLDGLVHALLYTRVSGAEHQKEGLSLDAQTDTTRSYAAARSGWVIEGEYQDIMTGKRTDRPDYQRLLEHARTLRGEHKHTAIVVVRLDRLGRNKAEYFRAEDELAKLGAEVHSIKDGGVLDDTHAAILAVFAAKEAKDIGQRVGETRAHLVDSGFHYGRTPFGYSKRIATPEEIAAGLARNMASGVAPHVFEPDPATRRTAREVFERVAAGESLHAVSRWLASLPDELRGSRSWPPQCVTGLLQSPSYVARPARGDADVLARPRARWEPLVTDELWNAVRARLDSHERRPHQATGRYLLTGFLRCEVCGHRMVGSAAKRGDRAGELRTRYRCTDWARGARSTSSFCRNEVPRAQADGLVIDQVTALLEPFAEPGRWDALVDAWHALDQPQSGAQNELAGVERDVAQAQKRLADAATMFVDGSLDQLGYGLVRDREAARIVAAETERARLEQILATQARVLRLPIASQVFEQAGGWARMIRDADTNHQRAILDELIEQVVVRQTGYRQYVADITWTPRGQRLATLGAGAQAAAA
jgi:site-specific DNA recombinase